MKLELKNIFFILSLNFLLVFSAFGQSSSIRISIKLIKSSEVNPHYIQSTNTNEVILNGGNLKNSNDFPRDLVLNFSDNSLNHFYNQEQITLKREEAAENIEITYNEQICLKKVAKNEKIKIIPSQSTTKFQNYYKPVITIAY